MELLFAMVIGAIVGAIIGGFSAAIQGGDIGKGMLYGAAAGAITAGIGYGISAYSSTTATAASNAPTHAVASTTSREGIRLGSSQSGGTALSGGSGGAGGGSAGFAWTDLFKNEGLMTVGGQVIGGLAQGAMAGDAAKEAADTASANSALQREHDMAMLQARIDAEAANAAGQRSQMAEQLAEERRQFDLRYNQDIKAYQDERRLAADRLSTQKSALAEANVGRRVTVKPPDNPSVQEQLRTERGLENTASTAPQYMKGLPQMDENGVIRYV